MTLASRFGGLVGTLMVAFFASSTLGGTEEGLDMGKQFGTQAFAAITTALYTLFVSLILLKIIDAVIGLRVAEDVEQASGIRVMTRTPD